jgi:hypothetical protein
MARYRDRGRVGGSDDAEPLAPLAVGAAPVEVIGHAEAGRRRQYGLSQVASLVGGRRAEFEELQVRRKLHEQRDGVNQTFTAPIHLTACYTSGVSWLVEAWPRCGVASSLTTGHPWQGTAQAGTRKINADPCPPPPHSAAAPIPPPRRFNSSARCKVILAPDVPIGWPMAMAPPLTLTFDASKPKVRVDSIPTAAKASLISMRSRAVGSTRSCAQARATRPCPGGDPRIYEEVRHSREQQDDEQWHLQRWEHRRHRTRSAGAIDFVLGVGADDVDRPAAPGAVARTLAVRASPVSLTAVHCLARFQ